MKKWKKVLSALAVAAVMSFGLAAAGCGGGGGDGGEGGAGGHDSSHTWKTYGTYAYENKGEAGHSRECNDCDKVETVDHHTYDNDQDATCDDCGYVREVGGGAVTGAKAAFFVDGSAIGDNIEVGANIADNDMITITADEKLIYAETGNDDAKRPTADTSKGEATMFNYGVRSTAKADASNVTYSLVAKKNVSLKIYAIISNDSYNSDKKGTIHYTTGDGLISFLTVSKRSGVPCTLEIDVAKDDTLTISADIPAKDGKLWLFGVDAAELSAAPTRAVTSLAATMEDTNPELDKNGSVVIEKSDITVLANGKYILDTTKWTVTYTLTGGAFTGNGPWTLTEAKTYTMTVSASKSGSASITADPISIVVKAYVAAAKAESSFVGAVASDTSGTFKVVSGSAKDAKKLTAGLFAGNTDDNYKKVKINGVEYDQGLKIDGSGNLQVTVKATSVLTLYVGTSQTLKVGTLVTGTPEALNDANNLCYKVEITLEEGVDNIVRNGSSGSNENSIFYAVLTPQ